MPWISTSKYPWTKYFIDERVRLIPRFRAGARVVDAFARQTQMEGEKLASAFLPSSEPRVRVTNTSARYGWTPPTGSEIQLSRIFVEELEQALREYGPPKINQNHWPTELEVAALGVLEATLMHEMVHYFRRRFLEQARLNMMSPRGLRSEEAIARQFEIRAYGVQRTVENQSLVKYFPRTKVGVVKP